MKRVLKFTLAVVITILNFQIGLAQDYVVNAKGDTLRGSIKVFNTGPEKRLQVVGPDKKKVNYTILQVRSFQLDNEIYQPVKGPTGYAFMKLAKSGYLSLYYFQLEKQMTYDGLFLTKKDGTSIEVPNLSFKKVLKKYLADCPATIAKLDDGTFNRNDLNEIIDDYNNCISANTQAARQAIQNTEVAAVNSAPWQALEDKVKATPDFEGKADALEMIGEIKGKLSRHEKVPNFMVEGLKSTLKSANVNTELEAALQQLK